MLSSFVENGLWRHATKVLFSSGAGGGEREGWTQMMCLLVDVYFDFVCQDICHLLSRIRTRFFLGGRLAGCWRGRVVVEADEMGWGASEVSRCVVCPCAYGVC